MRRRRRGIGDKTGTFVSTWQTDNAGTSGATQITLPLEASGDYDFGINWGDGTSDTITAYDQVLAGESVAVTHTYPIAGTYTVKIDGLINGWRFNYGGDRRKITDISQWGDLLIGNSGYYFWGCYNLNVSATDVLDVSSVTNFTYAFFECTSLTTLDVSNWDVSNVTTFYGAFNNCSSLDGLDISGFDLTELTNAADMLGGVTISNYSDVLIAWGAQATAGTIQSTLIMPFSAGTNTYSGAAAIAAKAALKAAPYNWDISDGGEE